MTPSHFESTDHLLEATTRGRPCVINPGLVAGNARVLLVAAARARPKPILHEVQVADPDADR